MTKADQPVVLSPPKLIGTKTVALTFGVAPSSVRKMLNNGDPLVAIGYLGVVAQRHTWNAHELFSGLYSTPSALLDEMDRIKAGRSLSIWCEVDDCEQPAHFLRLCAEHVRLLMRTWRRAEVSTLAHWRLLAMCRWVVDRNAHLEPAHGWDPWNGECMTPGCEGRTDTAPGRVSPLCPSCSDKFWSPPKH